MLVKMYIVQVFITLFLKLNIFIHKIGEDFI